MARENEIIEKAWKTLEMFCVGEEAGRSLKVRRTIAPPLIVLLHCGATRAAQCLASMLVGKSAVPQTLQIPKAVFEVFLLRRSADAPLILFCQCRLSCISLILFLEIQVDFL